MSAPANACWCANCRKTFPDLVAAATCPCGHGFPALRGEYVVNMHQRERARRSACSCGATLIFLPSDTGKVVPIALSRIRVVTCSRCAGKGYDPAIRGAPCPRCAGRCEVLLGLAHFLDCPDADRHRREAAERRKGGYASPRGNPERKTEQARAPGAGAPPPDRGPTGALGVRAEAGPGGRDQPAPRLGPGGDLRTNAQNLLQRLRASPDPFTAAELVEASRLEPAAVQRALAHLRAQGLARGVPKNAEAGEARNAWETTPRGDREDVPRPSQ